MSVGYYAAPTVAAVSFENVSVGAAAMDLFTLTPGTLNLCILGIEADNVAGTAAAGDSNEQFGRLSIIRGYTAAGSGGSVATPRVTVPSTTAGFTARVNDTTVASTGSPITCHAFGLPTRAGVLYRPGRLMRWHVAPGELLVVRLLAALTTPLALSLTAYVAEYDPTKHAPGSW